MTQRMRTIGAATLLVGLVTIGALAQTKPFPSYRIVLDGTARAQHYLDFFNYNGDFHKWVTQQPAAAAGAQLGVPAALVSTVDQVCAQVAAQMQQLAADRSRDLAAYPASQRNQVLSYYDFKRVRTSLEGALRLGQSLDETSWNKMRAYIIGPFQNLPKTATITWP